MGFQELTNDIRNIPSKEKIIVLSSVLLFLVLPLVVFVSTSSQKQETRSQAAEMSIDSLNTQVLENNRMNKQGINRFVLEDRRTLMEKLAYDNPQEFLDKAMNSDLRNSFPLSQRFLIEERVDLTGTLVPYHSDNFETGTKKTGYFVQTPDSITSVSFDNMPDEKKMESIDRVAISGYKIGNHLVVRSSDIKSVLSVSETAASTGTKKFAVLPINFTDNRTTPYSRSQMLKEFFCEPSCSDSLRTYYKTLSDGKITISGKVANAWIQTPFSSSEICSEQGFEKLISWARNYDPIPFSTSFYGVIFVYSKNSCNYGGIGTLGGNPSVTGIGEFSLRVMAHEIGHNLKLNHAKLLENDCLSPVVCKASEYGDKADAMGINLSEMNGPHLKQLGILPKSAITTTTEGGTFTINKLEGNINPRLIRLNIPNYPSFYIEYRGDKSGYDENSPYRLGSGAMIHSWNNAVGSPTYLLEAFDNGPVFGDGDTFSLGKYVFKQISHDNSSAKFRIIIK